MSYSLDEEPRSLRAGYQGKGHIVYEAISVFSAGQRLNRLRYACYLLTASLILALLGANITVLLMLVPQVMPLVAYIWLAFLVCWLGFYILFSVRRLHDMGKSGWLLSLVLAPLLSIPLALVMPEATTLMAILALAGPLFTLYLFAGAGTPGMNRFGTPNPPNGILVMVFGGLSWLFNLLALLINLAVVASSLFAPEYLERLPQLDKQLQQQQMKKVEEYFKSL